MKKILTILGSVGIIASGTSSVMAMSPNIKNETPTIQSVFEGTKTAKVYIEQTISDVNMGGAKEIDSAAQHNFEWSDLQIDKTIVSKMDYARSWLKMDISYWYSDNSGSGNWRNFHANQNLMITNSSYDSGVKEYNDERHNSGNGRATDHQWKWQVKVNQEGVYLWDWVWVWANGNWGNKATSIAGISINSFEYHFEFLV